MWSTLVNSCFLSSFFYKYFFNENLVIYVKTWLNDISYIWLALELSSATVAMFLKESSANPLIWELNLIRKNI